MRRELCRGNFAKNTMAKMAKYGVLRRVLIERCQKEKGHRAVTDTERSRATAIDFGAELRAAPRGRNRATIPATRPSRPIPGSGSRGMDRVVGSSFDIRTRAITPAASKHIQNERHEIISTDRHWISTGRYWISTGRYWIAGNTYASVWGNAGWRCCSSFAGTNNLLRHADKQFTAEWR
jgi:hypothetical protein